MEKFKFEELIVYKYSRALVKSIYKLIEKFPQQERNALSDQLRRAVISVPSNIAEGLGRDSRKDQARFLDISYGSLMETFCQLQLAADLEYITQEEFEKERIHITDTAKLLKGLIKSYRRTDSVQNAPTINNLQPTTNNLQPTK